MGKRELKKKMLEDLGFCTNCVMNSIPCWAIDLAEKLINEGWIKKKSKN